MSRRRGFAAFVVVVSLCVAPRAADAHVGGGAIVQDGAAGPYRLLVTIRPPNVVPGIAAVDVLATDDDVERVSVVPVPLQGEGVKSPPTPDQARRDAADPHLFTSSIWLMQTGSWQVRVTAEGHRGAGAFAVPVPALSKTVKPMSPFLVGLLIALLALLVCGAIAIIGASVREADLAEGAAADARRLRRGRIAMAICAGVLALAVAGGRSWWNDEARHYRRLVYKPMAATTQLEGGTLHLTLSDPGWLRWRKLDDLLPEHGHLMHLFAVRTPELDAIAHLHPASAAPPAFTQPLPPSGALPGGTYRLFGDIVHATGLDETATASLDLPATRPEATGALDPDDAWATIPSAASAGAPSFTFPDGSGRMLWTPPARLEAGRTIELVFEVQSPSGEPVDAIEPYMGMAGHAMILARDLTIFAHVHPTGSVPMAALALVPGAAMIDHARHAGMRFPARIQFPYNFPRAGAYRVFVQIKRAGKIQTAAYDVVVGSQQP